MNAPLRRSGVVIFVLFGLIFANLNWVQAYKADEYRTDPRNQRVQIAEYDTPRGAIEAGGQALAQNTETGGELKYQRVYPKKEIYAPVLGYKPLNGIATGIEAAENDILSGASDKLFADRLSDMFTGNKTSGGSIVLSLIPRAQEVAWKQMTNNERGVTKGAAVAIDPATGAVQAMVSMPSYNPNPLADHDTKAAASAYNSLNADKDQPLLNRATANTLPPGSVFKVIVSAAALASGQYNVDTEIPAGSVYQEGGATIRNSEDEVCPGSQISLKDALTTSCNTGYAKLGVKLGRDKVVGMAKAFGFEDDSLTVGDLESNKGLTIAASRTGAIANEDGSVDKSALAQSSLGQRDVRMTPLQGALMAATVANNGTQMKPYLVQQQLSSDRRTIYTAKPKALREPIDANVSGSLREMMVSVVENGTGKNAQIDGFTVGGKTGTAQNAEGADPHGWFIGFAYDKDGKAVSAVCVMLENVPGGHASAEAARIAGLIMKAAAGQGGN